MNNKLDDWFYQENEWKMKRFEKENGEALFTRKRERKEQVKKSWLISV